MAATRPDTDDLLPRYLAGELTPAESEAFERALSERAEAREQTELALKLKEGLARLHERGELAAVLRVPARPVWVPYAAAATIAVMTLTALAWFFLPGSPSTPLLLSPPQLVSGQHTPPAVVATYVLARMRDRASETEVERSGVVELRVLPSVLSPDASYRAEISASGGAQRERSIGGVDAGRAAADGYVTVYLDTRQLAPGDYEVSLSPLAGSASGAQADRFPIRLR